jgi:hypothetical protein
METPENSWFRREPPTTAEIQDVWQDLFEHVRDEVMKWTEPDSPIVKFLGKRTCQDMHVCISTKVMMLEDTKDTNEDLMKAEIPSFTNQQEEREEEDIEEENKDEEGGIATIENESVITDSSELLLHMEIRRMRLNVYTAGLSLQRFDSLGIQPNMALKAVKKLSDEYRQIFANIMLYQLAEIVLEDELDDETDGWADLPTVIDMHLDMPNIRAFHAVLAGNIDA